MCRGFPQAVHNVVVQGHVGGDSSPLGSTVRVYLGTATLSDRPHLKLLCPLFLLNNLFVLSDLFYLTITVSGADKEERKLLSPLPFARTDTVLL